MEERLLELWLRLAVGYVPDGEISLKIAFFIDKQRHLAEAFLP
jgi:hypothetical protein